MSPELSKLLELQELDLEVQRINDRLGNIPAERQLIEDQFNQFAADYLAIKERFERAHQERKELEVELLETQESHEKYKQDLMKVRNEKEYVTALREIDATKKHASALEGEILKRMEETEKLDAELKVSAPDVERKRAEVDAHLASSDNEARAGGLLLEEATERRSRLVQSIPRSLLVTYERVARSRRGQALSEVRDSICTGCRMKVRPKVFSDVRRGDHLITCDNCARILFYRPESRQTAEAVVS